MRPSYISFFDPRSGLRCKIDGSRLQCIHRFDLLEIHANRDARDICTYEALAITDLRNVQHQLVYRLRNRCMELDTLILTIETSEGSIVRGSSTGLELLTGGACHVTDLQQIIDTGHSSERWLYDVDALLEVHLVHVGDTHGLTGGNLLLDAHLLHLLDTVEVCRVNRLLEPCDIVWLRHLRELHGLFDGLALVGIDSDTDLVTDRSAHLLDTTKITLHVLSLIAADLELDGRKALRYIAAHILYELLIGKKK